MWTHRTRNEPLDVLGNCRKRILTERARLGNGTVKV